MEKVQKRTIVISILILVLFLSYKTIIFEKNISNNEKLFLSAYNKCLIDTNLASKDYCNNVLSTKYVRPDFYTTLLEVTVFGFREIMPLLFVIVVTPTLIITSFYYKSGIFKNLLSREKYNRVLIKIFKSAFNSAFILPTFLLISLLICFYITKSFDPTYSLKYETVVWGKNLLYNPFLFISLYLINAFLYSILYINIAIIISRKYYKFWNSLLLSFLLFIGLEVFLEIFVNIFVFNLLFKTDIGNALNIMNMFAFNDSWGLIILMLPPFIYVLISSISIYFLYKNKERFLYDLEEER